MNYKELGKGICVLCGTEFISHSANSKYCNIGCKAKAHKLRVKELRKLNNQ